MRRFAATMDNGFPELLLGSLAVSQCLWWSLWPGATWPEMRSPWQLTTRTCRLRFAGIEEMEAELSAGPIKCPSKRENARIRSGSLVMIKVLESLLDISGRLRRCELWP